MLGTKTVYSQTKKNKTGCFNQYKLLPSCSPAIHKKKFSTKICIKVWGMKDLWPEIMISYKNYTNGIIVQFYTTKFCFGELFARSRQLWGLPNFKGLGEGYNFSNLKKSHACPFLAQVVLRLYAHTKDAFDWYNVSNLPSHSPAIHKADFCTKICVKVWQLKDPWSNMNDFYQPLIIYTPLRLESMDRLIHNNHCNLIAGPPSRHCRLYLKAEFQHM